MATDVTMASAAGKSQRSTAKHGISSAPVWSLARCAAAEANAAQKPFHPNLWSTSNAIDIVVVVVIAIYAGVSNGGALSAVTR